MVFRKFWQKTSLLLSLGFVGVSPAGSTTLSDFDTQAKADFQSISDYINNQFANSMGFYSTLGWNNPPSVYDILSGPRVEVGLGAGADFISISGLNNLPLGALLVASNISLPSNIPVPFPIGTLRVGIINGLDAGFRLSYLPNIDLSSLGIGFSANYVGWGVDLRFRILDGLMVPTVTGIVSWDTMNGSFSATADINQTSVYNDAGSNSVTVTGTDTYTQNWNIRSFGAKIMIGKDLGVLYPFGAIGFQRNSGTVSSSIIATGTETVSGSSQTFNFPITSTATPVIFEPKFVLGFDLGEGFKWGVVGESNGIDIAGSTSFKVQF